MDPARKIITALGGPNAVARRIGLHRTRVSKWQATREAGGTGGLIPVKHIPELVRMAREKGIELSAHDFLPFIENERQREGA